jgi:hypothetical protein
MTGSSVLRKAFATVSVLAAVVTAVVAVFLVAGARSGEPPAYRLAAGLDRGLSCDRLRQWYVDHAVDRVTAWGWQSPIYAEGVPMAGTNGTDAAPGAAAPDSPLDSRTTSSTGTNVQEADVDEPDLAKVSGDLLVRVDDGTLKTDDLSGSEPRRLGVAALDRMGNPQLLLSGDRAIVVGSGIDDPAAGATMFPPAPRTWVRTYDLGDPANPTLVGCTDVAVPETFNGLGTLSIVGFDPADPGVTDATAVTTGSDTAYMSPTHLYVATSPWSHLAHGWGPVLEDRDGLTRIYAFDLSGTSTRYTGMGTVEGNVAGSWSMDEHDGVLRVAVSSLGTSSTSLVTFRPQAGRLLDVARLDGLGPGQQLKAVRWFDDVALLVTFRQVDPFYVVDVADPTSPRVLGELHLPGWSSYLHPVRPHLVLGLGQTTPQQMMVDPPLPAPTKGAAPSTAKPSDPVASPNLPVSVIRQRGKATLFDISDLARPRDVGTVSYPQGSMPLAAYDPHAVTWLPDRQVLLTVVTASPALAEVTPDTTAPQPRAWVSVLTVRDGALDNRMVAVPEALDAAHIRTLPLSDGRVVLVAGDSVRFLTV